MRERLLDLRLYHQRVLRQFLAIGIIREIRLRVAGKAFFREGRLVFLQRLLIGFQFFSLRFYVLYIIDRADAGDAYSREDSRPIIFEVEYLGRAPTCRRSSREFP